MEINNLKDNADITTINADIKSIKAGISSLQYLQGNLEIMNAVGALKMQESHVYNHTGGNIDLEEPIIFDWSTITNEEVFDIPDAYSLGVKTKIVTGAGEIPVLKSVNLTAFANIRLDNSNQSQDVFIQIRKVNNGKFEKIAESWFFHQGYAPYTHFCMAKNVPVNLGDKFYLYLIGRDCDINILGNSDIWQTALVIEPCEINI